MAHVVRIDSKHTHGHQARISRPGRKALTRLYSDRKYGGFEGSLKAAKKGLKELQALISPPHPVLGKRGALQANNPSGIAGVRVMVSKPLSDSPRLFIQASWMHNGKCGSTSYSVHRHGPLDATALALDARRRGVGLPPEGLDIGAAQAWDLLRESIPSDWAAYFSDVIRSP
jgi:hypothetical protein